MSYQFVPLPPTVERRRRPEVDHDRLHPGTLSGVLTLTYRTEQPVHIGHGGYRPEGDLVIRTTVLGGASPQVPVVPGSSFKGALRARYEAITQSCALFHPAGQPGRTVNVLSQSRPDIRSARLGRSLDRLPLFQACGADNQCAACALFGSLAGGSARRGRIGFADLLPPAGTTPTLAHLPALYSPRLHHIATPKGVDVVRDRTGDLFEVTELAGRKFALGGQPIAAPPWETVEAIPPGTPLTGTLSVRNLAPAELSALTTALGFINATTADSYFKVGAGRGHGFGRLAPIGLTFTALKDHRRLPTPPDFPAWRRALEGSKDHWPQGEATLRDLHRRRDC